MSSSSVKIRVPASTSNLGPGFDCLGLALGLHNTAQVTRLERSQPQRGMIGETGAAFFRRAGNGRLRPFSFEAKIEGAIPVSRGLGSSVTVRLGVLMGLAELVKEEAVVSREEILRLLIELEGHPDNAVPSLLGGFAVCGPATSDPRDGFAYTRVPVGAELSLVTLVPDLRLSTETARGLLPQEIDFRRAVENCQRTARIAALFCIGDYAGLRGLFVDHFHQPFRQVMIPGFSEILSAAREAGALGSFLSGSGSTLMAITLDHVEKISSAMLAAAREHELPARILVLQADNDGAQVMKES
jgi:homoserine kinase